MIGIVVTAKKSKENLVTFLESDESDKLWDKLADKVDAKTEHKLAAIKGEIQAVKDEIQVRTTELDSRIQAALGEIGNIIDEVPERVKMAALSERGVEERQLRAMADGAAEDLQEAAQQAMGVSDNPAVTRLREILTKPVDPEYEAKSPLGALIVTAGKQDYESDRVRTERSDAREREV